MILAAAESAAEPAAESASEPAVEAASAPAAASASAPAATSASAPAAASVSVSAAASASEPAVDTQAAANPDHAQAEASALAGPQPSPVSSSGEQLQVTAEEMGFVGAYKPGRGGPHVKGPPKCMQCQNCQERKLKKTCHYQRAIASIQTPHEAEFISKAQSPASRVPSVLLTKLSWPVQHFSASGPQPTASVPSGMPVHVATQVPAATTATANAQPAAVRSPLRILVQPKYWERRQPMQGPLAPPAPQWTHATACRRMLHPLGKGCAAFAGVVKLAATYEAHCLWVLRILVMSHQPMSQAMPAAAHCVF